MYLAHFGLDRLPFRITPDTDCFYAGGNRGAVLEALVYAVGNGEGIVKVVGEVGSGKTMLCRMLETRLPEGVETVYLANPSLAPEDILHAIAFELRLELPPGAGRLQVMQGLQAYLLDRHAAGGRVVVFVEEAQGMPLATLEEIRLLSNLETRKDKLLQIVLFGQPELDVHLDLPQIRQLRERITYSFHLGPLRCREVGDYLLFRLRAAGHDGPQPFDRRALSAIAAASGGLVRRINILADKAMLAAYAESARRVSAAHVGVAVRDSEFGARRRAWPAAYRRGAAIVIVLALGMGAGYAWLFRPVPLPVAHAPAPERPVAAAAPGVAPAEVPAPADVLAQRLHATALWLRHQPPSTVTVQLMGTHDESQLRGQLRQLATSLELDNLYVCRTQARGRPYYTLLYGSFPERRAALGSLQSLPAALRVHQPQLRTVGGLLRETSQG